ncbi:ROK family transcriptional regulator [Alicyclobacillus dauci]|uniref:ROK family transcriptional regulator n=1 Tax=Alicyclobacillus dauci TaxID=1475485 RepID=A0ABY6Z747_9BACL|nr:ROK family transcriptional regulator [Alicyclobacillus dauci]WAH38723.1 ROK family transcriptional regulator [Alicyclobacillus dauci]
MSITRGHPSLLRTLNAQGVLKELLTHGELSRPELARRLGLSMPTILDVVSGLIQDGVVTERPSPSTPRGRPAQVLSVAEDAAQIICLDVGGTNIKAGRFNFKRQLMDATSMQTNTTTRTAVLDEIASIVDELMLPNVPNTSIVIGAPGFVRDGIVIEAANLPDWNDVPLQSILEQRFGVPVAVENDVNLAVLGETHNGVAAGLQNVVFFAVSTGLGAGILVDGQLVRGFKGAGGELAFIVPDTDKLAESYGANGALESFAATKHLCRYWNEITGQNVTDPAIVANEARNGSPQAKQVFDQWAKYLGVGVVSLASVLNPEMIVIGGGGAYSFDLIEEQLNTYLKRHLPFPPKLEKSALHDKVALWGGSIIGLDLVVQQLTQSAV